MHQPLVVLDTNSMISHVWGSTAMEPIVFAIRRGSVIPVVSKPIPNEFREVVRRPKIAPYIERRDVETFLRDLALFGRLVNPQRTIRHCEDPDDDMVLECACEGNADYIISGDKHLLTLSPFEGIPILSPGDFVRTVLRPRKP